MGNLKSYSFLFLFTFLFILSVIPVPKVNASTTYDYDLAGAYNEEGYREGAINCTLYYIDNSSSTFTLDGTYNVSSSSEGIAFKFDLGYNESRTYYLIEGQNETIYVIKPTSPYYTYSFYVIDYIGVKDAYLETLININGTDRVVERWKLDVLNALPFTCSWGSVYKLRLVCDRGIAYLPSFVAGATMENTIAITSELFPSTETDISGIQVNSVRNNITWITTTYYDSDGNTSWVYVAIYQFGNSTPIQTTNVSSSSLTWHWYGADPELDYYVYILANHDVRGLLDWTIVLPTEFENDENPWDILDTILGAFPIDPKNLIGLGIVLLCFATFSNRNISVGLVVGIIIAMILTYIGWLDFNWAWLTSSLAIAVLVGLAIEKERMKQT